MKDLVADDFVSNDQHLVVIKIGGHIIDNETSLKLFIEQFSRLPQKKILVHGGGIVATRISEKLQISQQMIEGRRITDAETLKVIVMVYAGLVNKNIVALLQQSGIDAIGLSGADGNLARSAKRPATPLDYGFVGDVKSINADLLIILLNNNMIPVIAPVTHDGQGQLLNTNADTMAQEISKALSNNYRVSLIYTFEKTGVLQDINDEKSAIRHISEKDYIRLKDNGTVHAGMIPKLDNAFTAINSGVLKVIIGKAEMLSQLLEGSSGTTITA